jgi:release factor glutamine methyltransferase
MNINFSSNKISAVLKETKNYLEKYGILNPLAESEIILSSILNLQKFEIYTKNDFIINENKIKKIQKIILERIKRKPLEYIIGNKEFFGLKFKINSGVFIPRFETEILVETILNFNFKNLKILDIGTGCGNIAITLKNFNPSFKLTAIDISEKALKLAKFNSKKILGNNSIKFIKSNLFENIKEKFDIIVSNPPYIPTKEIENLMTEVKFFEPKSALDGKEDGLFFYKKILSETHKFLNKDGFIFFEMNPFLYKKIYKLFVEYKIENIKIVNDLLGKPRVIYGNL